MCSFQDKNARVRVVTIILASDLLWRMLTSSVAFFKIKLNAFLDT